MVGLHCIEFPSHQFICLFGLVGSVVLVGLDGEEVDSLYVQLGCSALEDLFVVGLFHAIIITQAS